MKWISIKESEYIYCIDKSMHYITDHIHASISCSNLLTPSTLGVLPMNGNGSYILTEYIPLSVLNLIS